MSIEAFEADPWGIPHPAYRDMPLSINPAPEFATGEVVLASTYRALGFAPHSEREVPEWGKKLDKASLGSSPAGSAISQETWRTVLHSVLESPKQPKQSSRRFIQLSPIVPDTSLYSGSARTRGNSWNPGSMVKRMIALGTSSRSEAEALWGQLFEGLSVGPQDDVWARWLNDEFATRRLPTIEWSRTRFELAPLAADVASTVSPAHILVQDLRAVLEAKSAMTRRQWVSLLEATLRLGTVAHVLWLCEANFVLWSAALRVLDGSRPPSINELSSELFGKRRPSLVYGSPALPVVRRLASSYLVSRLGLNMLLWQLSAADNRSRSLSSVALIVAFLEELAGARDLIQQQQTLDRFRALQDAESKVLTCKKGVGSNMIEFCRHTLGQRQTADETLRGYDQGYHLRKRSASDSSPWVVSLGPVALLSLAHCCLAEVSGPRSVQRLCEHMSVYGIDVTREDMARSEIGAKLRLLGLVLDSPDAEGGMLLVPPFRIGSRT